MSNHSKTRYEWLTGTCALEHVSLKDGVCSEQRQKSIKLCLPAFTGTLRTIPRDISVGYVTAIPKFNTILNAEIKNLEDWSYSQLPCP